MFTKLPIDIQEKIYNLLPVQSRTSLRIALPKRSSSYNYFKDKTCEKKLGILSKAIKKKKFKKLTPATKVFLMSIDKEDPTLAELSNILPQIGTISANITPETGERELEYIIRTNKSLSPEDLADQVMQNPEYLNTTSRPYLLYKCLLSNEDVFEAIAIKSGDVTCVKQYLQYMSVNMLKLAIKHIGDTITKDEYDSIYEKAVGELYIDTIEYLESIMPQPQ